MFEPLTSFVLLALATVFAVIVQKNYSANVECRICRSLYLLVCCVLAVGSMLLVDVEVPLSQSYSVFFGEQFASITAVVAWFLRVLPFALFPFHYRALKQKKAQSNAQG